MAEAARTLAELPVQRIAEFAQLDGERAVRQGAPEVIFGERKSPEQIGKLVARLRELGQAVLVTRLLPEAAPAAIAAAPEGKYDAVSRTFHAKAPGPARAPRGVVAVVCAGTTDIPVAEEAAVTAANSVDGHNDDHCLAQGMPVLDHDDGDDPVFMRVRCDDDRHGDRDR